jgi:hypothetical protein
VAEVHQGVALARAGRADQGEVIPRVDPLQRGEVGQVGAGMLLAARSNCSTVLTVGKQACLLRSRVLLGIPGGDLDLDQGPQQLLGGPALGLGGDQQLRGDPAHAGELSRTDGRAPQVARARTRGVQDRAQSVRSGVARGIPQSGRQSGCG